MRFFSIFKRKKRKYIKPNFKEAPREYGSLLAVEFFDIWDG